MSIQLPLLLASAGNLLPDSQGSITGSVPLGDIHALLVLLAVAPSMLMLVILVVYRLRGSRNDGEPGSAAKPRAEAELQAQFMRDAIEQLNGIAAALHDTILKSRPAPGQAAPGAASEGPAQNRHYLRFSLGDEQFAVSTQNIHSVVEAARLIAEPSIPPKIRQAIRLQGALVPVIDLGARFGGQAIELGRGSRIVVLEAPSGERLQLIGALVDSVGDVLELPAMEIEPPAASGSRIRDEFTQGTLMLDNRPVTLLDISRGFSSHEFVPHSAARPAKPENQPA